MSKDADILRIVLALKLAQVLDDYNPLKLELDSGPVSNRPIRTAQGTRPVHILTDIQQIPLTIDRSKILDLAGNPAPIDGKPSWSVSNTTLIELLPSEDGLSCIARTRGPLGVCQVKVTADADLGEGKVIITGLKDLKIVASPATTVNIEAGEPEPRPIPMPVPA